MKRRVVPWCNQQLATVVALWGWAAKYRPSAEAEEELKRWRNQVRLRQVSGG